MSTTPTTEEQLAIFKRCMRTPKKVGDTWFLISLHWLRAWKKYVGFPAGNQGKTNPPGIITNQDLMEDDRLRRSLHWEADVEAVPKELWDILVRCHGCDERSCLPCPVNTRKSTRPLVDRYGTVCKCALRTMPRNQKYLDCHADMTLGDLKLVLAKTFDIPPASIRNIVCCYQFTGIIKPGELLAVDENSLDRHLKSTRASQITFLVDTRLCTEPAASVAHSSEVAQAAPGVAPSTPGDQDEGSDNVAPAKRSLSDHNVLLVDENLSLGHKAHPGKPWAKCTVESATQEAASRGIRITESSSLFNLNEVLSKRRTSQSQLFRLRNCVGEYDDGRFRKAAEAAKSPSRRGIPGVCGLLNERLVCYLNSCVQCLSNVPKLTNMVLLNTTCNHRLVQVYQELLRNMWTPGNFSQSTKQLSIAVAEYGNFQQGIQHDAHEWLIYFIEMILKGYHVAPKPTSDNYPRKYSGPPITYTQLNELAVNEKRHFCQTSNSAFSDAIHTLELQTITCEVCNYMKASFTNNPFLMLCLPPYTRVSRSCTLQEILCNYTSEGKIEWKCPHCQVTRECLKRTRLWSLPDVLILILSRAGFDEVNRTLVDFPISNLDMSDFVHKEVAVHTADTLYDLVAVSNHMGGSNAGHYVTFARNAIDNQWYTFDDESVHQMDSRCVSTNSAYLLMYQKASISTKPLDGVPERIA